MRIPLPIRVLSWPLSVLYGFATRVRLLLYEKRILTRTRLKAPVISVGNLTVGGTGKTPMVIWLAEKFLGEGKRVAILSRGYRGTNGTSDEIELMKRRLCGRAVFGIGRDRYGEGSRIESVQPVDVFLLDDGYQHLELERDVNVLMLDGSRKIHEEWLLPAGELREPVSACSRADLIVVTRKHEPPDLPAGDHEHQIFYAQTRLLGLRGAGQEGTLSSANELARRPLFALCGIGNPKAFFDDLKSWRVAVTGTKSFRDHHRYSQRDAVQLAELARQSGAKGFITTEKDEQNLACVAFELPVHVAVIDFVFAAECELDETIRRLMDARRSQA